MTEKLLGHLGCFKLADIIAKRALVLLLFRDGTSHYLLRRSIGLAANRREG